MDDFARRVGAINTVRDRRRKAVGSEHRGPGFARAIRSEFSVDLRDLRVLLLGAGGGAGRAIAMQCAAEGCERLVLVNRTFEKAQRSRGGTEASFRDARVSAPGRALEAVAVGGARPALADCEYRSGGQRHLARPEALRSLRRSPLSLLAPHLMVYDTIYAPHADPAAHRRGECRRARRQWPRDVAAPGRTRLRGHGSIAKRRSRRCGRRSPAPPRRRRKPAVFRGRQGTAPISRPRPPRASQAAHHTSAALTKGVVAAPSLRRREDRGPL